MNRLVIAIYGFLRRHPLAGWIAFLALTAGLAFSLLTLRYKEDISDFLPMDEANRTALSVYQDVSGANNIYAVVSAVDTSAVDRQALADAVECLVEDIRERDTFGLVADITAQIDMEQVMEVADRVYADIPLFLTDADYARMDSLLAVPGYISRKVAEDKEMLLFPSSQFLVQNISRDPLGLFSPVVGRLSHSGMSMDYETYDGYILSPDGTKAIAVIRSASGASESDANARLLCLLDSAVSRSESANPAVDVHIIGGPAIAVSNAGRIRQDSMLAIALSGTLILGLLVYVFRNARNILLILVSVGWGWLFAMGVMALLYDSVSIIVIGIASVILGIAVNYPLHLIDHLRDSDHPRAALREIISPLIVGNVTTVGAFLCLVPLDAPALHDLGVFSSLLLVGTIVFVLVFLPHAVKTRAAGKGRPAPEAMWITRLAGLSMENHPWVARAVLLLTVVFACFSLHTEFDSDMRNINYMTEEQKADFEYFNRIFNRNTDTETAYLVSSGRDWETALAQNEKAEARVDSLVRAGMVRRGNHVSSFLMSRQAQVERLRRWQAFVDVHADVLRDSLAEVSRAEGFAASAFQPFHDILSAGYAPRDFGHFSELASTVFAGNVSEDAAAGRRSIVQTLELRPADMERVRQAVEQADGYEGMLFDVRGMNEAMAGTLSDNFNYIGLACGCIVFLFLWFSFGNVELAIASFVPMAVSWLWILGIMAMLGIRFNIVNIILATFIFGQGDDYTIFMTEGLTYEYAYRRKLLASYKNSIVVSALIMFIGIGTLNFAQHPALHSLGEVIVVGMFSVVLMAYLFPPLIFNSLVRSGNGVRPRPLTLGRCLRTAYCTVVASMVPYVAYAMGAATLAFGGDKSVKRQRYRRRLFPLLRLFFRSVPGVRVTFDGGTAAMPDAEASRGGTSVLCLGREVPLCRLLLAAFSPDVLFVSDNVGHAGGLLRRVLRWGGYECSLEDILRCGDGRDGLVAGRLLVTDSYASAVALASGLRCPVCPLYVIGAEYVLPEGGRMVCAGHIYIGTGARVPLGSGATASADLAGHYEAGMEGLRRRVLGLDSILPVVFDRYRYKGSEVETYARRALRRIAADPACLERGGSPVSIMPSGPHDQGELALVFALMHPDMDVCVTPVSDDARDIILGCIDGFVDNVTVKEPAGVADA